MHKYKPTYFICLFLILFCNALFAQEDKEYKIEGQLYTYYHECQENRSEDKVLLMADTLFSMAKAGGDIRMQAVSLSLKLDYFYFKGEEEDSIIYYVDKVKKFASETNQLKYYYFAWSDRLILHYLKTGNVNMALYQAQEMLKDAQTQDSKIGLLSCYNSLYQIYEIKDLRSLAIEYCLKAIELSEMYEMDNYNISISYAEVAKYYVDQHNADLALEYLKKAEASAKSDIHIANAKMIYVRYYLSINKPSEAWNSLQESKMTFQSDKKTTMYLKNYYEHEYYYYMSTNQYVRALESVDKQIEEELGLNERALRNGHYRKKGEIFLAMNRKDLAAEYLSKYIILEDSLRLNNEEITTSGYATLVNLEKVEREKNELLLRAQKKELHTKHIVIFSLTVLLLLVLYFLYRESLLNKCLKHSEDELRKAMNKAEIASKAKTNFIQSMSHEIRTPLNSIVGFSQVLGSKYEDDLESKEFASIIETNSNHLLRLITHVLELSDLDKSDDIETSFVTDINNCCRVSIDSVRNYLQPGVDLSFTPSSQELIVHSNPDRIMQVLINLLHNATKFTTQGSITLSYMHSEKDKKVFFSVSDTGIGIPVDKHEEVFERFAKLDAYAQGTGLGLSISKEISMRLGGELYIDEDYTRGTRFVFVIQYN